MGKSLVEWIRTTLPGGGTEGQLCKPSRELRRKYDVERLIERGGHGDIWLCSDRQNKAVVACKVIDKTKLTRDSQKENVQRETQIMRRLSQGIIMEDEAGSGVGGSNEEPGSLQWNAGKGCIVDLKEVLESKAKVEIVMEYCNRGDLHDLIRLKGPLSESDAKSFFTQLVLALDFCHSSGVVHRDIKPENVLLTDAEEGSEVTKRAKLCDFGLAALVDKDGTVKGSTGSNFWIAPEVVQEGSCGAPADVWSLGLVLYAMLTGNLPRHPQRGRTGQSIWQQYYRGPLNIEAALRWEDVPAQAQDLLKKMLRFRPERRISVEQIFSHPWVAECDGVCGFSLRSSRTSSLQSLLPLCSSVDSEQTAASMDSRSLASSSPYCVEWRQLQQASSMQGRQVDGERDGSSWHGSALVASRSLLSVLPN